MPVNDAVCQCDGIQPLLLTHPCVCISKDMDIQCIPETEEGEVTRGGGEQKEQENET